MALILLAVGALFGVLFLLNNLLRTLFRSDKIRFLDLLLAFLVTLVPLTALIANSTLETPAALIERGALWLALFVVGVSLVIVLLELFRPQRLRGSRGLLGFSSGLLLLISSFTVPFMAAYFALAPTATATSARDDPETTESAEATDQLVERSERFNTLFRAVRLVVSEEIEIGEVEVFTQLDQGKPLAEIVEENGGDIDHVIARISEIMRAGIREAADLGEMNPIEAALLLSQMDTLIRIAVYGNLMEFGGRFGGPTPTGTRPSLLSLLTEPAPETTRTPEASSTSTPTASETPAPSATPTNTRTPRPTAPPTATRFHFSTRTPVPTATAVAPCLASVEYNLRLRALPSEEAETLLVIPYTSTIELYGHNQDSTWWATTFEGQSGWVDSAYLMLSAACAELPVVETE